MLLDLLHEVHRKQRQIESLSNQEKFGRHCILLRQLLEQEDGALIEVKVKRLRVVLSLHLFSSRLDRGAQGKVPLRWLHPIEDGLVDTLLNEIMATLTNLVALSAHTLFAVVLCSDVALPEVIHEVVQEVVECLKEIALAFVILISIIFDYLIIHQHALLELLKVTVVFKILAKVEHEVVCL